MAAHIKVEDLALKVPLYVQNDREARSWRSLLLSALLDPPHREFRTLLDGVSFEVNEGDRIAILGRNGAGKSTLLRCLNGVYQPSRGRIEVKGTCQALLNTSLGFNGEATVKENIFLRANAMRLEAISLGDMVAPVLEFAGLKEKANHRLKTLSAGQKMRLGFAISTEMQHDIMLLDEWIGAGDSEFLKRAKQRMLERMGGSKIVMLASHNVSLLKDVCNKGMVMEAGRVVYFGPLVEAFKAYQVLADRPPPHATAADDAAIGSVDEISVRDGKLRIRGWAVQPHGDMPRWLAVVSAGERWLVTDFEPHARHDVQEARGLPKEFVGFDVEVQDARLEDLRQLGGVLQVYGGGTPESFGGPFNLQAGVLNALQ